IDLPLWRGPLSSAPTHVPQFPPISVVFWPRYKITHLTSTTYNQNYAKLATIQRQCSQPPSTQAGAQNAAYPLALLAAGTSPVHSNHPFSFLQPFGDPSLGSFSVVFCFKQYINHLLSITYPRNRAILAANHRSDLTASQDSRAPDSQDRGTQNVAPSSP